MKLNPGEVKQKILELGVPFNCKKLEIHNIVFPQWDELGLLGMVFRQCVRTKEQPAGNIYDEAKFQTVLRIIGGKVLISEKPDCYCWKFGKLRTATSISDIGTASPGGIITLCKVLNNIHSNADKALFADMFASLKRNLLLVTTPVEKRKCIQITQKLYDAGITHCVDEWMEVDENGLAEATELSIGDYVIITEKGLYRIGLEEFLQTHVLA